MVTWRMFGRILVMLYAIDLPGEVCNRPLFLSPPLSDSMVDKFPMCTPTQAPTGPGWPCVYHCQMTTNRGQVLFLILLSNFVMFV